MTTVLVTDGEQRAALAVVRSLAAQGHRCVVCSTSGRSIAGASRGAAAEHRVPDPGRDAKTYVEAVERLLRGESVDVLLPIAEPSLLALLPARDRLEVILPLSDAATFRRICDKRAVLEEASRVGIRVPAQHVLETAGQAVPGDVAFPVVAKPSRSVVVGREGGREKVGVRWAGSAHELERVLGTYPPGAFPVLLQEVIEGPGVGVFLLLWDGRLLGRFSHRRIREKPPSGGVSVVRDSEPMDPDLLERSLALLRRFDWQGPAMVEYKVDAATGESVLMEINGRFWGSLQLAVDAGVDFPALLVDAALGRAVEPVEDYRYVRSRWFWGDVDHLIARWREPVGLVCRLRALITFLTATGPRTREELFRFGDVRPFFRESRLWLRDVFR